MELVITLIAGGFLLLFLETYLPGMIAGIVGTLCILFGVILGFSRFGPQTGAIILGGVAIVASIGFWAYVRYFPETRYARRFISNQTVGDIGNTRTDLLQKQGVAHTHLRPCGTAIIEGQRVDVITEGSMIERGTPIQVVAAEGLRIVVRAIQSSSPPPTT